MADEYITHIQPNTPNRNEDQTTESTTEMINTVETPNNAKPLLNCMKAAEHNSANTLHESQPIAHEPISDTANWPMQTQGERVEERKIKSETHREIKTAKTIKV